jgi:hypothetical protein
MLLDLGNQAVRGASNRAFVYADINCSGLWWNLIVVLMLVLEGAFTKISTQWIKTSSVLRHHYLLCAVFYGVACHQRPPQR